LVSSVTFNFNEYAHRKEKYDSSAYIATQEKFQKLQVYKYMPKV
jgi:hypothetical protein